MLISNSDFVLFSLLMGQVEYNQRPIPFWIEARLRIKKIKQARTVKRAAIEDEIVSQDQWKRSVGTASLFLTVSLFADNPFSVFFFSFVFLPDFGEDLQWFSSVFSCLIVSIL